jgi:hypothetical protein
MIPPDCTLVAPVWNRGGRWFRCAIGFLVAAVIVIAVPASPLRAWADEQSICVDANVRMPLRDGRILRADVIRPASAGRYPAILWRTPYGKEDTWKSQDFLLKAARCGYAVIVQDVRGRYASAGSFDAYRQETEDGYDSVEWAAMQPFCDGRVGMAGLSYPGAVQWLAAVATPPHLSAIAPAMCFSNGRQFFYFGGAFDLSWIGWTYNSIAPDLRQRAGLPGPVSDAEVSAAWTRHGEAYFQ